MSARTKHPKPGPTYSSDGNQGERQVSAIEPNETVVREFLWDIVSISTHFEDIRQVWAQLLGVSGPQWLILMAIDDLDTGKGVSVGEVSEKIHVHSTFVTAQTKNLERSGFLKREVSTVDARVVLISFTEKARQEIAKLSVRRKALNDFIFSDLNDRSLRDITDRLSLIRNRVERAALQIQLDRAS